METFLLKDPLPVQPLTQPLRDACVELPGSKSITNRALILAALCPGKVTLENALFSRDTELMVAALTKLGFSLKSDSASRSISVEGLGGHIPNPETRIDVGNAGTVARFLTAFLSLKVNGEYYLDGDSAMRERPMKGLLDALENCGAAQALFHKKRDHFPFTLKTNGFPGGAVKVDAKDSSQILSALLMIAPFARRKTVLIFDQVRAPFVMMTLSLMRDHFGMGEQLPNFSNNGSFCIPSGVPYKKPEDGRLVIEADATAASYFASLPIVTGGSVLLKNHRSDNSLQGDNRFLKVLEAKGFFHLEACQDGSTKISAKSSKKGAAIDFNDFSDTFLTFAALSPILDGVTSITGIGHTRYQETDRVGGMAKELGKLLGEDNVIELTDGLEVHPDLAILKERFQNECALDKIFTIETYQDHRFAMSFAILGCYDLLGDGTPWLQIKDPGCCGKTFPSFFQCLDRLRHRVKINP